MLDSTTGSRDGRLKGLGTFIISLNTRERRLGTSGILLDTGPYENFTDWHTGRRLGPNWVWDGKIGLPDFFLMGLPDWGQL